MEWPSYEKTYFNIIFENNFIFFAKPYIYISFSNDYLKIPAYKKYKIYQVKKIYKIW